MDQRTDSLAQKFARENWNRVTIAVAYAGGQRLPGSVFPNRAALGDRVWAVGSVGVESWLKAIGYVGYTSRPQIDTLSRYSAWAYGARVSVGSATLYGFAEFLGQSSTSAPAGVPHTTQAWSARVDFRVAAGFWIETGFGKQFQELSKPEHVVVIAGIKWGILSKPALIY